MSLLSESGQLAKLTRTLQFPRSAAAHYWLAVVAVAALLLLRLGLGPLLHGHGAFLLFIPAILLAAGVGMAMASVFDVTHNLHGLSALIGIPGISIAELILGNTAERVLHDGSTDVLVVTPQGAVPRR